MLALDEVMNHTQQLWNTLYLVDDDQAAIQVGKDELREPLGTSAHFAVYLWFQQIHDQRIRIGVLDPTGLARAAGSEEKETLFRWVEETK